ncbi:MAG: VWA domain-containing protein [Verrucomicrobia subdivision 3 bacterium]|nr:VWA domain-containing protein [Limisphaerales bacterium]
MKVQFTNPHFLWLLPMVWAWATWLARKSDVQAGGWRRATALSVRMLVLLLVVLALAGLQWMRPLEGVNVFFLLDRSESIPSPQQEAARKYVNAASKEKKKTDKAGVLVFGTDAAIEISASSAVDVQKINAVVPTDRTDVGAAIRLGTAAFPETGQKRIVLLSDGNENFGDAMAAVLAARPLGVTVDVIPLGVQRSNDVSVQKLALPNRVKKGQTFETRIFINSDNAQRATLRLYRNDQPLGEQKVELNEGKNLFTFPQTLSENGFYGYNVFVDTAGDRLPQNNQASSFTHVRGDPNVLILSAEPSADQTLAMALRSAKLEVKVGGIEAMPRTLAEIQSYDTIFVSNIAAGDLGEEAMKLLESAVRDFGVGLVCVGGDQAYAAGGYRGTPLETTLPVNMELDSKKVLPSGAVALVMHGMEFMDGNQIAIGCALGVLDALGPQDEMGVVLWDGKDDWLFPMTKVGDKRALGKKIAGMNQGDLPTFQNVMTMAHEGLKKSTANLKHMIIFSDGDPAAPSQQLMHSIVGDRITVSTVLIAGHAGPETMQWIADQGRGRFHNVNNPGQLPQIFIKEAAVILKSAIFEEPFKPKVTAASELIRGIAAAEYPNLRGYVCTTPKTRAEIPLISDKGDPVLAHWQYGLGRAVAFTSDAKAKWAREWLDWQKYRQFWAQTAQWSLRRLENADFATEVSIDRGEGHISVEALDPGGDYRNFLNLQTVVVSPTGERQTVRLEQTGPGRYEARFPTKQVGSYLLNLMEIKDGQLAASQVVGASVNYSPEFSAPEPNINFLNRLAEAGGGRLLDPQKPADNPFLHERKKTYQPQDLWEWLLKFAVILFTLDIGVRRVHIDREEWLKATQNLRRIIFFWHGKPRPVDADESLAALLARREHVRTTHTARPVEPAPDLFRPHKAASIAEPARASVPQSKQEQAEEIPAADKAVATTTGRLLEAKRKAQRRQE